MLHFKAVTSVTGAPFIVALDTDAEDHNGDSAGRVLWFDMRTDPVDPRHPDTGTAFTVAGLFVTDWTAATFMAKPEPQGAARLWGDEPSWEIGAAEMRAVRYWVATCYSREGREVPQERPYPELDLSGLGGT